MAQLRAKLKHLEEVKPPGAIITMLSILLVFKNVILIVPQHEAALREIVELRRKLNEFQANSLTQSHLHSVSAFEMKAKVSASFFYCKTNCLYR